MCRDKSIRFNMFAWDTVSVVAAAAAAAAAAGLVSLSPSALVRQVYTLPSVWT
jgi:hypothetical protein